MELGEIKQTNVRSQDKKIFNREDYSFLIDKGA
jgi:hypothetical protein